MADEHSITQWLAEYKEGDPDAGDRLADRFLQRLANYARGASSKKFGKLPSPTYDHEDAAVSALASFFVHLRAGEVHVHDRDHLRALLARMTLRKLYQNRRRLTAKKRGGRRSPRSLQAEEFDGIVDNLSDPAAAAVFKDTYDDAMAALDEDECRIAELRTAGYQVNEISEELQVTERTVHRKLKRIRETWDSLFFEDEEQ